MSRKTTYNQNEINDYKIKSNYDLRYLNENELSIIPLENDSGRNFVVHSFSDNNNRHIPVVFDNGKIDIMKGFANIFGGRIDGIDLAEDRQYLIWAFADNNYNPVGYGISQIPYSVGHTIASGNKGALATLTGIINAYRFTIGSKVRIVNTNGSTPYYIGEWNLGIITTIDNATQIKVKLDDNAIYGTNLVTNPGVYIEQLDSFIPMRASQTDNSPLHPNYKAIGMIETFKPGTDIQILRYFRYPLKRYNFYYGFNYLYHNTATGPGVFNFVCNTMLKYCPENISAIYLQLRANVLNTATTNSELDIYLQIPTYQNGVVLHAPVPNIQSNYITEGWIQVFGNKTVVINGAHTATVNSLLEVYLKGWEM